MQTQHCANNGALKWKKKNDQHSFIVYIAGCIYSFMWAFSNALEK